MQLFTEDLQHGEVQHMKKPYRNSPLIQYQMECWSFRYLNCDAESTQPVLKTIMLSQR